MLPELDPDVVAELSVKVRQHLRQSMRRVRKATPADRRQTASDAMVAALIKSQPFASAQSVALFWPMLDKQEIDTRPLLRTCLEQHKRAYFPYLDGTRTGFREVTKAEDLSEGPGGFFQPGDLCREAARGEIDLVLVPALAVAPSGHRLGYGRGYYDATLPDVCPPARAVAMAYDFQLVNEVPARAGDVPVDFILTETRWLKAGDVPQDATGRRSLRDR